MNIIIFLILGFSTTLLFPPYFFLPLGFIIFPILCLFFDYYKKKIKNLSIFLYSFVFGFGFFFSLLFWIKNPFFIFEETKNFFYVSILLIILLSLIFSIIFLIFFLFNKKLSTIFLIPIIFIFTEFIISIFLYGFPWITFSLIISNNNSLIIFPKFFGTLVSSYFVLQFFCLPYIFFEENFNYKQLYKFILLLIPAFLMVLIFNFLYSSNDTNNKVIDLEIVQLNFKNNQINDYEEKLKTIKNILINSNSEVLIFAENNYPYLITNTDFIEIQNNLKENQTVIIGATRKDKNNNYYNSLLNISHANISYFDKKILVPFGEFLPLRNFLSFFNSISGPNDYTSGKKQRIIKLNDKLNYIPVICYEIIFYWKIINSINYNSNLIVNITNDIWFGKFLGPYQHFYHTKLRAAEFNKTIVRVSNNGVSGIIDYNGQILTTINLNESSSKKYQLILKNNINYYHYHYFLNLYFFALLIFIIFLNLKKR